MTIISVRVSEEEKKELEEYGSVSEAVREGLKLYLKRKKTGKIFRRLEQLQERDRAKTTSVEEVELIREDRKR